MKKCPRCHKMTMKDDDAWDVLSWRDNKTHICNRCGWEELDIDNGIATAGKRERDFVAKVRK